MQGAPLLYNDAEEEQQQRVGLTTCPLTAGDRLLFCNVLPILPVALLGALVQVRRAEQRG